MKPFRAGYNDGVVAVTRKVSVTLSAVELEIRDGGAEGPVIDRWPRGEVRLVESPRWAGAKHLRLGEGGLARLSVDDDAAIASLLARLPNLRRGQRASRATLIRGALWSLAAVASAVALVVVFIPMLSQQIAAAIPPAWKESLGAGAYHQIARALAALEGKTADEIECGGLRGRAVSGELERGLFGDLEPPMRIRIHVLDTGMVNAFALPGGHIILLRGMLDFAEGPEEVVGVLAHEAGHVAADHPTELLIQFGGTSLLIALLVGDITGGSMIALLADQLINAAHSRDAEREADAIAVAILNEAGVDARPMADMFDRLLAEEGTLPDAFQIISTHPPTAERAAAIRASATGRGAALGDRAWKAFQGICGRQPE